MRSLEAVEAVSGVKIYLPFKSEAIVKYTTNLLDTLPCPCKSCSSDLYEVTGGCRGRFKGKNILALQV